ncbi:MAG TPA: RICIN domain-containing protein [Pseudonocardiaceae bacterium]
MDIDQLETPSTDMRRRRSFGLRRLSSSILGAAALATAALVLGGLASTPAIAATAPTSSAPQPSTQKMASLNPGDGVPADQLSAAAIQTCAKVAAKAGFSFTSTVSTSLGRERSIAVAVAIAMAESSCNPSATNINSNGSEDRGLWQINNAAWPNVSNACAFQVQCNADAAFNISNRGSDWNPWSTYGNGAWRNYISSANSAISGFSFQLQNKSAGTCLDADGTNIGNGGKIFQWTCNASDSFQQWTVVIGANGDNPILRNVGSGTCLDADGTNIGNGGKIFQWACNSGDKFQVWWFNGSGQLNTNGNANAGVQNAGGGRCLDADGTNVGSGGKIFQWACNGSDGFQEWN